MTIDSILELQDKGYCVLKAHFPHHLINACRDAFGPVLSAYLQAHGHEPNRGPYRHFLPMPFDPPCFAPEFFFDEDVLSIVRGALDDRVVADQWGCDGPSEVPATRFFTSIIHRPLFAESPDLELPTYMLVVSFGLVPITLDNGPLEVAPGTHRMPRSNAIRAVESAESRMEPVPLEIGDVLIRHPWVLHRGTPNMTDTPRTLATIRHVRRWYADSSRAVNSVPHAIWNSLTPEQRSLMRFPVGIGDTAPSVSPKIGAAG